MNIRHTLTLIVVLILVTCLASVASAQDNPLTFTINQQTGQMTFTNNIAETVTIKAANGSQAIAGGTTFSDWWAPLDFLNQQCSSNSPSVHTDGSGRKYYELRYSYEWQHSYGGDKITGSVTAWYYCDNAAAASSGTGSTTSGSSNTGSASTPTDEPSTCSFYVSGNVYIRTAKNANDPFNRYAVLHKSANWYDVDGFSSGGGLKWLEVTVDSQTMYIARTSRVHLSAACGNP